ncbi:unnamed protein product [Linum trigynum]|uniref:Uncharacterized protein n=1 Tax=Linum trigynum TaxID=586398 RepID=A0AAV2F1D9_9ROSI
MKREVEWSTTSRPFPFILYPFSSSSVSNYPIEEIVRDGEDLEIGEEESRELVGEKVVHEINGSKERAAGEGGRDGAIEVVGVEAEEA